MPFSSSNELISSIKKQLGLEEKTYSVMRAWDKEFAPVLSYAELVGIQKGELIIEVLSSVHFQELSLRKNEIIKKINQYAGKEKVVKGIKIRLKS